MRRPLPVPLFAVLFVSVFVTALPGCQPEPEPDAQVEVTVLRGDLDPLRDPGGANREASPVGSLNARWITSAGVMEQTVALTSERDVPLRFASSQAEGARLVLRGLRAKGGGLYSAGRSLPVTVAVSGTASTSIFFGPAETFTPVGAPFSGPRMAARAVPLGTGALVVGGVNGGSVPYAPAEPSLLRYVVEEARLCGEAEGCLSGEVPAPRVGGVAVALPDGSVLHGLGALVSGVPDASLFRTDPTGRTERLQLGGDPLPGLIGASAVALPSGEVVVAGGNDGTQASGVVYRVVPESRTVIRQADPLLQPREEAGIALLVTGQLLLVGGKNASGTLSSAEVLTLGAGSEAVDGKAFSAARGSLKAPRVAPALVPLSDDGVLVAGGGVEGGEVFRLDLGQVGGFVDLSTPSAEFSFHAVTPAAVRLPSGEVLLTGGERPQDAPVAVIFRPDPDQVLGPDRPVYTGGWRAAAASSELRARAALVVLGDESVLLAGGGTAGETADTMPNPGGTRVEVMVTAPSDR